MKIEKIYKEGANLAGDARDISNTLYAYNPGLDEKLVPAAQIAHSIAVLMQRYAKLRVDLLEVVK